MEPYYINIYRFISGVIHGCERLLFRFQCFIHGVRCEIGDNTSIRGCRVYSKRGGEIVIGSECALRSVRFGFYGKGGRIELKDRVFINAHFNANTHMFVKGRSSIIIGSDCLLSNSIDISTTDWHRIYSIKDGALLNPEKDVHIGNHVWIGRKVIICKGAIIPDGAVIGVGSIVTKAFYDSNVIIAGNPAIIKKGGINWQK